MCVLTDALVPSSARALPCASPYASLSGTCYDLQARLAGTRAIAAPLSCGLTKSNVKIEKIPEVDAKVNEVAVHLCRFPIDSMLADGERDPKRRCSWDFH